MNALGFAPQQSAKLPYIIRVEPDKAPIPRNDLNYIYDFKYDGHSGVLYWNGHRLWFRSKEDKDPTYKWLERRLVRCLRAKGIGPAIFDGEIVALDKNGFPVFADVRKGHEVYVPFDMLWIEGNDLRGLPLINRRIILEGVIAHEQSDCMQAPYCERETGLQMFDWIIKNDFEGLVAKPLDKPYDQTAGWVKSVNPYYSQNELKKKIRWNR